MALKFLVKNDTWPWHDTNAPLAIVIRLYGARTLYDFEKTTDLPALSIPCAFAPFESIPYFYRYRYILRGSKLMYIYEQPVVYSGHYSWMLEPLTSQRDIRTIAVQCTCNSLGSNVGAVRLDEHL